MRRFKLIIFVLIVLILVINIYAIENGSISYEPYIFYTEFHGIDSCPAYGSCMILIKDSVTTGKISDKAGMFNFENLKPGKYIRKTTSVGYVTIYDSIEFGMNDSLVSDSLYFVKKRENFDDKILIPQVRLDLDKFIETSISFSGYIFSIKDSLPIHSCVVKIYDTVLGAVPNADGYFIVKNLDKGKYHFTVSSLDYKVISDTLVIDSTNVVDTFYLEKRIRNLDVPIKVPENY